MAKTFSGILNRPGIQYPEVVGLPRPVKVAITSEFLTHLDATGFRGVSLTLNHDGEQARVGTITGHRMHGDALWVDVGVDDQQEAANVQMGILLGSPVQMSFELADIKWSLDPLQAAAQDVPTAPMGGRVSAVSLVEQGACGAQCSLTEVHAHKAKQEPCCGGCADGHGCEGDNSKSVRLAATFEATMPGDDKPTPEVLLAAANKDLKAANDEKARLETELTALREQAKAAPKADDLAKVAERIKPLEDARVAQAKAEHDALVESVKEVAPKGFEVDASAPAPVLTAMLKAFRASTPAVKAHKAGTSAARSADGEREAGDADRTQVIAKFSALLSAPKSKVPAALRTGGYVPDVRFHKEG